MTPEQKQRIEQIRERQEKRRHEVSRQGSYTINTVTLGDIDFLLSLVKSQEADAHFHCWHTRREAPSYCCRCGDLSHTDIQHGDTRTLNEIRLRVVDGYESASGQSVAEAAHLMLNDLHYVLSSHGGQFARGCSACIEKVKACAAIYAENDSEAGRWMSVAAADIITALESVSIQEQEAKQS